KELQLDDIRSGEGFRGFPLSHLPGDPRSSGQVHVRGNLKKSLCRLEHDLLFSKLHALRIYPRIKAFSDLPRSPHQCARNLRVRRAPSRASQRSATETSASCR